MLGKTRGYGGSAGGFGSTWLLPIVLEEKVVANWWCGYGLGGGDGCSTNGDLENENLTLWWSWVGCWQKWPISTHVRVQRVNIFTVLSFSNKPSSVDYDSKIYACFSVTLKTSNQVSFSTDKLTYLSTVKLTTDLIRTESKKLAFPTKHAISKLIGVDASYLNQQTKKFDAKEDSASTLR